MAGRALALVLALFVAGCASAVVPMETPRRDIGACREARALADRIGASPYRGVKKETAERLGRLGEECARIVERERAYNAAAARANKPDGFLDRLQSQLYAAGVGFVLGALAVVAVVL